MKRLAFLTGWGYDARIWSPVAERLAGRFEISFDGEVPTGAIVCGWSLGAMRALALAASAMPERLVLVAATPRFVQGPGWPHGQPPELLQGFAEALRADPAALLRRFNALIHQGDANARALTRQTAAALAEPDTARLQPGLAELAGADLRNSAVVTRQPALVIHGERDPLMPPAAGRWLADHLPAARFELFAGAAHAPFLSDPDRFARLVVEFAHG